MARRWYTGRKFRCNADRQKAYRERKKYLAQAAGIRAAVTEKVDLDISGHVAAVTEKEKNK